MSRPAQTFSYFPVAPDFLLRAHRASRGELRQPTFELDRIRPSRASSKFLEGVMDRGLAILIIPGQVPGLTFVNI
jgi:hypothetical protein